MGNTPVSSQVAQAAAVEAGSGVEEIRLVVTFPKAVKSVNLTSDVGVVTVDPRTNDLTWFVGRLPRDKMPELSGSLHLAPGAAAPLEAVHATLHFSLPGTTVSGLAVKDLLLSTEKYKFFKGVKATLKTGRYQVRT